MKLPKSIQDVVDGFSSLPGVGPKSAQRLAFYMLRIPKDDVNRFASAISNLKDDTKICQRCYNFTSADADLCEICGSSHNRDVSMLCVVESPLDVIALEKSGYKGLYHVLHGVINPIAGIGPDEIFVYQLFDRVKNSTDLSELILATSTSLEGESTSMFIRKELSERGMDQLKVTRIGRGLPIGADIEYADEKTLSDALAGRVLYT